jgi:hypothetical protein
MAYFLIFSRRTPGYLCEAGVYANRDEAISAAAEMNLATSGGYRLSTNLGGVIVDSDVWASLSPTQRDIVDHDRAEAAEYGP